MNYEEIIEMVIDEITESALAKYRKENVEINELLEEQQEILEELDEAFCCSENSNLIERYIAQIHQVAFKERNYLYVQGMKDSISLLKELKII